MAKKKPSHNSTQHLDTIIKTDNGTTRARLLLPIQKLLIAKKNKVYHFQDANRHITEVKGYRELLDALEIEYTEGNDAPRGGKTGNYLELTAQGIKDMRKYRRIDPKKMIVW